MSRTVRSLAPLHHRGYRLLAAGQFASHLGDAFYVVALPWYVLSNHGGVLLLGAILAAYGIPRTGLIAVGGHACDRWRPWMVMMANDSVRALAVAALTVAALGPPRAVVLVPLAVVLGAGEAMFLPGSMAVIPALLPGKDLQAGNALAAAGTQLAMLVGSVAGGLTVALLGPSPAFGLDAASFVISALTLAGLRANAAQAPQRPAGSTAAPGLGFPPRPGAVTMRGLLRSSRVLQIALLVAAAANLGSSGAYQVALPSLAHGPLHTGAAGYGGLVTAFAAGALLGPLVAGHLGRVRRPAVAASAAFLAEALFMAMVPYLGSTYGAGAALLAWGVMGGFGNVVMITAWQQWAPRELLGRLTGLVMTACFGVYPVSVLLGGVVVHELGPAAFFPMGAATLALAIVIGLSQRTWRDFGAIPAEPVSQPAVYSAASVDVSR